jgi:hypothetical protein
MKPIRTEQSNFTYGPPAGMTAAECDLLPCCRTSDGRVISVWEFTPEERQRIAAGDNLELHVFEQPTPPVGMQLTALKEVTAPQVQP